MAARLLARPLSYYVTMRRSAIFVPEKTRFFRSRTDLISLLILFLFFLFRRPLQKSSRLRHFKSDRDDTCQDCPSSKHASTITESDFRHDVRISRWRPMTSFHTATRGLAGKHKAYAGLCVSVRQFPIYRTFVVVLIIFRKKSIACHLKHLVF